MKRLFLCCVLGGLMAALFVTGNAVAYVTVVSRGLTSGGLGEAVEVQMDIPAGLSLFALPGVPGEAWTASVLVEKVRQSGGSLKYVKRLNEKGALEVFTPFDFNLEVGLGYLIENATACKISVKVSVPLNTLTTYLRKGPNIVSVPTGGPYTAATLLADLQAGGTGSQFVIDLRGSALKLFCPAISIKNDFAIEAGRGYLIAVTKDISWTAQFITPSPVQDNGPDSTEAMQLKNAVLSQISSGAADVSNRPPVVVNPQPDYLIAPNASVASGRVWALDLDGDSLMFSAQNEPPEFGLDFVNGTWSWYISFAPTYPRPFTVTFGVSDGAHEVTTTQKFADQPL